MRRDTLIDEFDELDQLLHTLNSRAGRVSIVINGSRVPTERGCRVVMRLIVWDENEDGSEGIRDLKEQEVLFADAMAMLEDRTRLTNIITGWKGAFSEVVPQLGDPDALMPTDFWFHDVMALTTPETPEQWHAAFLTRGRFGKTIAESNRS